MWRLFLFLPCVLALPSYRDRIPNGHNVPHPCNTNTLWNGVGHDRATGSGPRNPFGLALQTAGYTWTEILCNADSDQDGITNGEELGDPGCIWMMGQEPTVTNGITHPGVCEPVESEHCQEVQPSMSCDRKVPYECDAVHEPGVKVMEMKFPMTYVPVQRATYYCQKFKVPDDQLYHAVAFEPIIDNINVVHHMIVYACDDRVDRETGPEKCDMLDDHCHTMIGVWTIRSEGQCITDKAGIKFGKRNVTHILLQIHWMNPLLEDNYQDSSGMRIYYTPKLRQYDQQIAWIGQTNFRIPPLTQNTTVTSTCPSQCTQKIGHPVTITNAMLHMHYLGHSGKSQLYRNGTFLMDIVNEVGYSYESPVFHTFDPPIVLLPGDFIVTTCQFNTLDGHRRRENETFYGDRTQDEMCFTILWCYPAIPEFYCVAHGSYQPCTENCDMIETSEQVEELITYLSPVYYRSPTADGCKDSYYNALQHILGSECVEMFIYGLVVGDKAKSEPSLKSLFIFILNVWEQCRNRHLNGDFRPLNPGLTTPNPGLTSYNPRARGSKPVGNI